jgi:hypothetical protein
VIDIVDVNRQLVQQDVELRSKLAVSASSISDPSLRAVAMMLADGIAAVHERQGNGILLMLQSAS